MPRFYGCMHQERNHYDISKRPIRGTALLPILPDFEAKVLICGLIYCDSHDNCWSGILFLRNFPILLRFQEHKHEKNRRFPSSKDNRRYDGYRDTKPRKRSYESHCESSTKFGSARKMYRTSTRQLDDTLRHSSYDSQLNVYAFSKSYKSESKANKWRTPQHTQYTIRCTAQPLTFFHCFFLG